MPYRGVKTDPSQAVAVWPFAPPERISAAKPLTTSIPLNCLNTMGVATGGHPLWRLRALPRKREMPTHKHACLAVVSILPTFRGFDRHSDSLSRLTMKPSCKRRIVFYTLFYDQGSILDPVRARTEGEHGNE